MPVRHSEATMDTGPCISLDLEEETKTCESRGLGYIEPSGRRGRPGGFQEEETGALRW